MKCKLNNMIDKNDIIICKYLVVLYHDSWNNVPKEEEEESKDF